MQGWLLEEMAAMKPCTQVADFVRIACLGRHRRVTGP
jgi:hypothetical protein